MLQRRGQRLAEAIEPDVPATLPIEQAQPPSAVGEERAQLARNDQAAMEETDLSARLLGQVARHVLGTDGLPGILPRPDLGAKRVVAHLCQHGFQQQELLEFH